MMHLNKCVKMLMVSRSRRIHTCPGGGPPVDVAAAEAQQIEHEHEHESCRPSLFTTRQKRATCRQKQTESNVYESQPLLPFLLFKIFASFCRSPPSLTGATRLFTEGSPAQKAAKEI